jgi:hypothetical protein
MVWLFLLTSVKYELKVTHALDEKNEYCVIYEWESTHIIIFYHI